METIIARDWKLNQLTVNDANIIWWKVGKPSHDFASVIALGYVNVVSEIPQNVFKLETLNLVSWKKMMSKLSGKISKTISIAGVIALFETPALQPQVSNIPTALVSSLFDNSTMLYIFWFDLSTYIDM